MSNIEIFPVSNVDFQYNLDKVYEYFQSLNTKQLMYEGSKVIFEGNRLIHGRESDFWHLVSLDDKDKFEVLPCTRCETKSICPKNCNTGSYFVDLKGNMGIRNLCAYRAHRINFIEEILGLYSLGDPRVLRFKKRHNQKKRSGKEIREYLRFTDSTLDIDYLIVLTYNKTKKAYVLITAFPVFYERTVKSLDATYKRYCKSPF